jgi:hypothetical protein
MEKNIETEPKAKSAAEFERMCAAYDYDCLVLHAYDEAERLLLQSAKAVRELLLRDIGPNDRDLIASHYAITAAHVAKGLR